ncbi:MAG: ATP-binding cassette domain-containing protein [Halobacteriota archaeon]|nr:ATP-binding cassette domain-containing protein [Halobacteriota archaeon]
MIYLKNGYNFNSKVLDVRNISKSFNSQVVIEDLSFGVEKGEIFGLLGPNGAGKTTLIRIILDIIRADSGDLFIFGEKPNESVKGKIGYLPEERGLYQKMTVLNCLKYLQELKGVHYSAQNSCDIIDFWLKKFGLFDQKDKKIETLSKGTQQKIQIISTLVHNPELLILDEPFSGLDPVNLKLYKDLLLDLKERGKTIILSTHQMDQVERMCDRILMIDNGERVLYGTLDSIKKDFEKSLFVEYEGHLGPLEGIKTINDYGKYAEISLKSGADPQKVLESMIGTVKIRRFEMASPSLNEIFIEVAGDA